MAQWIVVVASFSVCSSFTSYSCCHFFLHLLCYWSRWLAIAGYGFLTLLCPFHDFFFFRFPFLELSFKLTHNNAQLLLGKCNPTKMIKRSIIFPPIKTFLWSIMAIRFVALMFISAILVTFDLVDKHLWTFFTFQIIHVNLTNTDPKLLEAGRALEMTYSVKWVETDTPFARRFDIYLDHPFFEHQVILIFFD